jgi:D-alanyl-lipoteichoic acid acyltransferase DltB (MBOAT superfamily)
MLFNSVIFIVFISAVFPLYWLLKNKRNLQNFFILVVSYIFYAWWDWRFLSLIIISSFLDYSVGIYLERVHSNSKKNLLLLLSIFINIGFLWFFKYYNFFVDQFIDAFKLFGINLHARTLNIILPVGISFYTFQTLSYTIDVYKSKLKPTYDIISFFAYVSFFPQLVAGPIERAKNLLPQFYVKREFNYKIAKDGLRQILWGLFKKVVIADGAARTVDLVFDQYTSLPASTLLIGIIFFSFQIYCDFSGYSDIAIGLAKLLGFRLMQNFNYPYFSRDIAEFWRRWHISLSTWFRDYLYIPIGGSKGSKFNKIRNIFIIFIVSGFWHGANWTFIIWGALNALFFLPLLLTKRNRTNIEIVAKGKLFPSIQDSFRILSTFLLTTFAWIFFRSDNLKEALGYIKHLFDKSIFSPAVNVGSVFYLLIIGFIIIEWFQREKEHALDINFIKSKFVRWGVYYSLCILIFYFFNYQESFIYFQF